MRSYLEGFEISEKSRIYLKKLFVMGLLAGFLFGLIGFEPAQVSNNIIKTVLLAIIVILMSLVGLWFLFPVFKFFKALISSKGSRLRSAINPLYGLIFSITPVVLAFYQYNSYSLGFGGPPPLLKLLTVYIGVSSVIGSLILGIVYYFNREHSLLGSNIHLIYAAIFFTGFLFSGFAVETAGLNLVDEDTRKTGRCSQVIQVQCATVNSDQIDLPNVCLNQKGELNQYFKEIFKETAVENNKFDCKSLGD